MPDAVQAGSESVNVSCRKPKRPSDTSKKVSRSRRDLSLGSKAGTRLRRRQSISLGMRRLCWLSILLTARDFVKRRAAPRRDMPGQRDLSPASNASHGCRTTLVGVPLTLCLLPESSSCVLPEYASGSDRYVRSAGHGGRSPAPWLF